MDAAYASSQIGMISSQETLKFLSDAPAWMVVADEVKTVLKGAIDAAAR